jgi:hypothetical protein
LLDVYGAPGVTTTRVYIGTNGISAGTRIQTARSCVRLTYDEFFHATDTVFDGAVDFIWSDDTRGTVGAFGGSLMQLDSPVFYDCTNNNIKMPGNRTRTAVVINNAAFNPISVDCVRCVDMSSVKGLVFNGGQFGGSVANKATTEWLRLIGCEGVINGTQFNDLAKSGTVDGNLTIRGCRFAGTDGLTLAGGKINASSNIFTKGTYGYTFTPTYFLAATLGPDEFGATVTNSYYAAADSVNLSINVNYDRDSDSSTSKFSVPSLRFCIRNNDRKLFTDATATYTLSVLDTGRTVLATGAAGQVFTLPTAMSGVELTVTKYSAQTLQINGPSAGSLYGGVGAAKTSVSATAGTDTGGTVVFTGVTGVGWFSKATGSWTYA